MDYGKVILPAEAGSKGLGFRAFAASRSSAARAPARRARSESCVGEWGLGYGRNRFWREMQPHVCREPVRSRIALALSICLSLSRALCLYVSLSLSVSRCLSSALFGCARLCAPRPVRILRWLGIGSTGENSDGTKYKKTLDLRAHPVQNRSGSLSLPVSLARALYISVSLSLSRALRLRMPLLAAPGPSPALKIRDEGLGFIFRGLSFIF